MGARSNQVRIIAGQWRGRKLSFPDSGGLRPTSDRIRETLFNWLAPMLPGATCLDLFAGSGALGFEAASREAARVVVVENNSRVAQQLRENRDRLSASAVDVVEQQANHYLSGAPEPFDLVFLDPPFAEPGLLSQAMQDLTARPWLNDGARIYLELPVGVSGLPIPESWQLLKDKRAGQVAYQLYRFHAGSAARIRD